jgi:hypothetical protein
MVTDLLCKPTPHGIIRRCRRISRSNPVISPTTSLISLASPSNAHSPSRKWTILMVGFAPSRRRRTRSRNSAVIESAINTERPVVAHRRVGSWCAWSYRAPPRRCPAHASTTPLYSERRQFPLHRRAFQVSVCPMDPVEQGRSPASPALVSAVARALNTGVADLLGQPFEHRSRAEHRLHATIPPLRRELAAYTVPPDEAIQPRSKDELADAVTRASQYRHAVDLDALGAELPGLLCRAPRDDRIRGSDAPAIAVWGQPLSPVAFMRPVADGGLRCWACRRGACSGFGCCGGTRSRPGR